jgi:hypothetical protein
METTGMRLGEILVGRGLVSQEEVDAALARQRAEGGRLGNHLVAMGALTVPQLLTVLRDQKDIDAAIELCERSMAKWQANFGEAHANTSRARCQLARAYLLSGRATDSLAQAEIASGHYRAAFGAAHDATREAEQIVAEARQALARSSETTPEHAG